MAHHASRLPACANCGYDFRATPAPDHFCPNCGQQNQDLNVSFGHLLEEVLEGLFHFDGKVFRTLGLLLFRPGRLTRAFNAGRRVSHVAPIRLYVFISFVFFLLLSLLAGHDERRLGETTQGLSEATQTLDSVNTQLARDLPARRRPSISLLSSRALGGDSVVAGGLELSRAEFDAYRRDPTEARTDALLRSKGQTPTFWNRLMLRQEVRLREATVDQIWQRLLKNISIGMFVLMPLFALLLKLLYLRHRLYYIGHLVFSLHLHCFIFVLFLLNLLWNKLVANDWMTTVLLLAPPVYLALALRHVYAQPWPRTLLKAALLIGAYGLLLALALLSVLVLSFAQI